LDKWLWQARFFKTRSLASRIVTDGQVWVNAQRVVKAATSVRPGDVLTFAQGAHVRVIKITALGLRRGPASEAQGLFDDLTPPLEPGAPDAARVGPRPTKRDRRALDAFQDDLGPDV
jgi:ribosome-associated heat shock protein Hsp15